MTRETALERVAALVAKVRSTAATNRQLAAALDIKGVPTRFPEEAAEAATKLERLAAELDAYFTRGG